MMRLLVFEILTVSWMVAAVATENAIDSDVSMYETFESFQAHESFQAPDPFEAKVEGNSVDDEQTKSEKKAARKAKRKAQRQREKERLKRQMQKEKERQQKEKEKEKERQQKRREKREERKKQEEEEAARETQAPLVFFSLLNAAQEMDGDGNAGVCRSSAMGNAVATLKGREFCIKLSYGMGFTKLPEVRSSIHGPAAIGENAPALFHLSKGTIKTDCITIRERQKRELMAGKWYFNIRSKKCLDGEIRGQILPQPEGSW